MMISGRRVVPVCVCIGGGGGLDKWVPPVIGLMRLCAHAGRRRVASSGTAGCTSGDQVRLTFGARWRWALERSP